MGIRSILYSFYKASERLVVPRLRFSQYLYQDVLEQTVHDDTEWLDLGCGHQLLPEWREREESALVAKCRRVVGVDEDLHSLQNHRSISNLINGSITHIPLRSGIFDLVTANMVVEHLSEPVVQFREINRVLKPGGTFLFHTPNVRGYLTVLARMVPEGLKAKLVYILQGRKEEDVFPTFYRANSSEEVGLLAEQTGFEVAETRMLVSTANLALIPLLSLLELLWIRVLMGSTRRHLRPYMIVQLRKKQGADAPVKSVAALNVLDAS